VSVGCTCNIARANRPGCSLVRSGATQQRIALPSDRDRHAELVLNTLLDGSQIHTFCFPGQPDAVRTKAVGCVHRFANNRKPRPALLPGGLTSRWCESVRFDPPQSSHHRSRSGSQGAARIFEPWLDRAVHRNRRGQSDGRPSSGPTFLPTLSANLAEDAGAKRFLTVSELSSSYCPTLSPTQDAGHLSHAGVDTRKPPAEHDSAMTG